MLDEESVSIQTSEDDELSVRKKNQSINQPTLKNTF